MHLNHHVLQKMEKNETFLVTFKHCERNAILYYNACTLFLYYSMQKTCFSYLSVYIPVNATSGNDLVRLFAMVGGGYANPQPINDVQDYGLVSNYTWNIQVRQIDCTKGHPLEAPPGCLQYFTQPTDTIGES